MKKSSISSQATAVAVVVAILVSRNCTLARIALWLLCQRCSLKFFQGQLGHCEWRSHKYE
jgi:hypothetical protein